MGVSGGLLKEVGGHKEREVVERFAWEVKVVVEWLYQCARQVDAGGSSAGVAEPLRF